MTVLLQEFIQGTPIQAQISEVFSSTFKLEIQRRRRTVLRLAVLAETYIY